MSIKETTYKKWNKAYEIVSGEARLIVVTEIGPRVLSLQLGGGPNLLFNDDDEALGFKDWKIYGGHRFWIGPETLPTYAPDNTACSARIEGGALVVESPSDPATGLAKTLIVAPAPGGFRIAHRLANEGPFLAPPAAIWGLTCVRPAGVCAFPWRSGPERWSVASLKIWAAWADHGSNLESPQWVPTNDLFEAHPTGEEGKAGTFADRGWIAQWTGEATFVKQSMPRRDAQYPDGGCNLEMYTCGHFIEMETLSPLATLGPGETLEHEERWHVSRPIARSSAAVDALIAANA